MKPAGLAERLELRAEWTRSARLHSDSILLRRDSRFAGGECDAGASGACSRNGSMSLISDSIDVVRPAA